MITNKSIDEQQDDITHLKDLWDIDDEDEVEEIMVKNPIKNILCVTHNQTIVITNGWKCIFRKSTLSSGEITVAKCS